MAEKDIDKNHSILPLLSHSGLGMWYLDSPNLNDRPQPSLKEFFSTKNPQIIWLFPSLCGILYFHKHLHINFSVELFEEKHVS